MGEALLSAEPRCLRVALEHEAVAVMHEPIEHGVGDGAIAEVGVPLTQRQLAGDVTPEYLTSPRNIGTDYTYRTV